MRSGQTRASRNIRSQPVGITPIGDAAFVFTLSGHNPKGLSAPDWLIEGSLDYEAFRLFADVCQVNEFERARAINKDRIWGLQSRLSSLDTMDHAHAEDSHAAWTLGLVATESLARNYGEQGVVKKNWEARSTRTWEDVFRIAFGVSPSEFYKEFEEYRRANFPSYCSAGGDQASLTISLVRQLSPGSFHAFPESYLSYVFCVSGGKVGTWTSAQREAGFKKPAGAAGARVHFLRRELRDSCDQTRHRARNIPLCRRGS